MQDRGVQEYCNEVVEEFVKVYNDELEIYIDKMLKEFGFKGKKEDSGKFLEENGYQLLFDGEQYENYSTKIIYLVKDEKPISCFMIKILYGENLAYEISDIFVYREED